MFFSEVVELARRHGWASDEHFSVDATLIEAWASMKSFKPKDQGGGTGTGTGNPWTDFKGEKRRNDTHESTTDPEAKFIRKGPGREARLCFAGHAAMENHNGLCVLLEVHPAVGTPVFAVAIDQTVELRNRGFDPKSVGADKEYYTTEFVQELREQRIVPHPACKAGANTLRVVLHGRICGEPEDPQAHRRTFRLGQNHRLLPQESLPRRGVHARGGAIRVRGVQSGAHGKTEPDRSAGSGAGLRPAEAVVSPDAKMNHQKRATDAESRLRRKPWFFSSLLVVHLHHR